MKLLSPTTHRPDREALFSGADIDALVDVLNDVKATAVSAAL